MQISASLLAAQQQPQSQRPAQPSAFGAFLNSTAPQRAEAAKPAFEPAQFTPAAPQEVQSAPAPEPATGFRRPGSTLDIRV